jgi:hypothetical protein
MNIPIYRAKQIDSDKYVEGYYFHQEWIGDYPSEDSEEREEKTKHFITGFTTHDIWDDEEGHFKFMGIDEIDATTLAIHFPDMLDNQGNKIFASLSEDGKGGDICATQSGVKHLLVFKEFAVAGKNTDFFGRFTITNHNGINKNFVKNTNYKIIGIQR